MKRRAFVIYFTEGEGGYIEAIGEVEIEDGIAHFSDTLEPTEHGRDILAGAIDVAIQMLAGREMAN